MEEANGNDVNEEVIPGLTPTPQGSLESLSEYTDAHEDTASAPTEFLAEFLSAIMIKDYDTALKYCKLILQYEPHNVTAKELYPLIIEKIQLSADVESSGEESSGERSDGTTASYSSLEDEEAEDLLENGNPPSYAAAMSAAAYHQEAKPLLHGFYHEEDHQNGNAGAAHHQDFIWPSSSEESSPTEPVSQALAQPMTQLRL